MVKGETLEGLGVCQRHAGGITGEVGCGDSGSSVEEAGILGIVSYVGAAAATGAASKGAGGG